MRLHLLDQPRMRGGIVARLAHRALCEIVRGDLLANTAITDQGQQIRITALGKAPQQLPKYTYDPKTNTVTDNETGKVYHEERGTFLAGDGEAKEPLPNNLGGWPVSVGFDNFLQIFVAHGALARGILFLQAFLQHFRRGLQVDHEVGCGQLLAKIIVVTIIGVEFGVGEVEAGEELIFFDDVIGDDGFLRARPQVERLELFEALHQKCELRLKCGATFAFVKSAEEWIDFGLHHALRIQPFG